MATFKYKKCVAALRINKNETVAIVEHCDASQTLQKFEEEWCEL